MAINPFEWITSLRGGDKLRSVKDTAEKEPKSLIGRAYNFAKKAHHGQKRQSGEPYFNHLLATAEILNDWHLDETTIAAGLLHDSVEDTKVTSEELQKEFGEEIAFLVNGISKLGRVKYREKDAKVENMRKMIVALSEDLRVILIKLADRLHNMRTLSAVPPQKQKRIALETDDIYAPLAYRLGMHHLAGELHDLAFPYLHPKESEWLQKTAAELYENRRVFLEKLKPIVEEKLKEHNLKPITIDFRAKRISSLYEKLLRHDMDMEKIYDLVAIRLIFETSEDCYAALGVIHKYWPPLPGRIKDYIAMPKPNGYQSLHTVVIGPENKLIEFQLRSRLMHEHAEKGIAAHWVYKDKKAKKGETPQGAAKDDMAWIQELRRWQESHPDFEKDAEKFLESMKVDFFRDRIFALTPRGEVIDLPNGATPIDFAYHIHTDIGDSCVGAKVNSHIVPLDYTLRSGDMVEIMTQKKKKPSEDWLRFVKTASATNHIKSSLRTKHHSLSRPTRSEFRIAVEDRYGLIKDISTEISRAKVNIIKFETNASPGSRFPIDKVQCDTTDRQQIERLVVRLKNIKGVREVSWKIV
jgi:GTP pyrophosphokinase